MIPSILRGLYRYGRLQILRERRRQKYMTLDQWLNERTW
jgi:hypothetical protein